jgi:hypothetical protein
MKELLSPIVTPCPAVDLFDINANVAGRSSVFERMKKAVASRSVIYEFAHRSTK